MNAPTFPTWSDGTTPPNVIHASIVNTIQAAIVSGWPRSCEVDFGGVPTGPTRFTVTDALVTTANSIAVWQDGATPTGGFGDEAAWDPMIASAVAGTGQFTLNVSPRDGLVVGKFKFIYVVG